MVLGLFLKKFWMGVNIYDLTHDVEIDFDLKVC